MARCLKLWENVYDATKHLSPTDAGKLVVGVLRYAFDGVEPELKGSPAAVFASVKPLLRVYDSDRAFVGSIGGASASDAKSRAQLGNQNASKTQAKRKQNASKTQAISMNGNENNSLEERTSPSSLVIDCPVNVDGSPVTVEQMIKIGQDIAVKMPDGQPIPEEFVRRWFDEVSLTWIRSKDNRPIRTLAETMKELIAFWKVEKKEFRACVESPSKAAAPRVGASVVRATGEEVE